jgi:hypothetical protein
VNKIKFKVLFLVFSSLLLFTYSGVIYLLPNYIIENTKLDSSHKKNLKSLDALIKTLEQFKELEVSGNDTSHKIIDSYAHFNKALFGILLIHIVAMFSLLGAKKT